MVRIFIGDSQDPGLFAGSERACIKLAIKPFPQGAELPGPSDPVQIIRDRVQGISADEQCAVVLYRPHLPFNGFRPVILIIILFISAECDDAAHRQALRDGSRDDVRTDLGDREGRPANKEEGDKKNE